MLSLIPIYDDNPTRRVAYVTYLIIALNILVFLTEPVAGSLSGEPATIAGFCRQTAYFRKYAAIPRELTTGRQLPVTAGPPASSRRCELVRPDYHKNIVLSVLYAMFLHGSWLHLLGNMLFLFVFGNNVEDRLGTIRYLFFYLACGYVATYGFAFFNAGSTETLVGASGAIAGVLGAYAVLYPRARVTSLMPFLFFLPIRLPALIVLGTWFLLQWLYFSGAGVTDTAGVAYGAHVVGFLAGMVLIVLLGGLVKSRRPPPEPPWTYGGSYR